MSLTYQYEPAFRLDRLPPDDALTGREAAEVKAMAATLAEDGQLDPIGVALLTQGEPHHDLLRGTRRVKAARLLGWPALRAEVVIGLTPDQLTLLRSVDNSARARNRWADVEALRLLLRDGLMVNDMARLLRKSAGEVKQLLKYVDLPPVILAGAKAGKIRAAALDRVAKMSPERRQQAIARFRETGRLTSTDMTELLGAARSADLGLQAVPVPGLLLNRPTLTGLLMQLVSDQQLDLSGRTEQVLRLRPETLAELRRLLPVSPAPPPSRL